MRNNNNIKLECGAYVWIKGHKCCRCGHEWRPKSLDETPRVCPSCKNPYWDRPKREKEKMTNE